jgi:diguanylate cyclase (GGDEF)-like protein
MDKPVALIIEDDRDIVALFRHVLDISGYQTDIVLHGQAALEHLSESRPDIILLDLNLPGASGIAILEMLQSDEHLKGVPVIVITAHANIAANLPVEPDLVLLKPVNINHLGNLAQRLCSTEDRLDETPWDKKTNLYNRSFFIARLEYAIERSNHTEPKKFAVLFLDLDRFKMIENQIGQESSASILRETANILKNTLRPTDTIARFQHDHFLILIEEIVDRHIPTMIARRVQENLNAYLTDAYHGFQIQSSIGIIIGDEGYGNIDEILRDADTALYLAKAEGGACHKIYDRVTLENLRKFDKISRIS